jgi:hypothetical protein
MFDIQTSGFFSIIALVLIYGLTYATSFAYIQDVTEYGIQIRKFVMTNRIVISNQS